jgi:hypothetical protein
VNTCSPHLNIEQMTLEEVRLAGSRLDDLTSNHLQLGMDQMTLPEHSIN